MKADVVVFDPNTVADRATYEDTHQYAVGMSVVIVNGEIVLDGGTITASRPGRVLRRDGVVLCQLRRALSIAYPFRVRPYPKQVRIKRLGPDLTLG